MTRLVPVSDTANRRVRSNNALPSPIQNYLNQLQMNCLRSMELLDWRLLFVRRENCVPPLVVLRHKDTGKMAVIDERGVANFYPRLTVRAAAEPVLST